LYCRRVELLDAIKHRNFALRENFGLYIARYIDAKYVDIAIRRWQIHSSGQAIHAVTGGNLAESVEMCTDAGEYGPAVPEPLGTAW
jgi:hypothetical protein